MELDSPSPQDLVLAHIGEGEDRTSRFFELLRRPVVPSALLADRR